MIPIRDRIPTRTFPWVTYLLIATNVIAFFMQWALIGAGDMAVIPEHGLVPLLLVQDPVGRAPTILTSMFLHGGFSHLGGNMLYLWIFGDNVEDAIGHLRYLLFYLLAGVGAAVGQISLDPGSAVPMVGASGAIAGVLAAYVSLYPRSPITSSTRSFRCGSSSGCSSSCPRGSSSSSSSSSTTCGMGSERSPFRRAVASLSSPTSADSSRGSCSSGFS